MVLECELAGHLIVAIPGCLTASYGEVIDRQEALLGREVDLYRAVL